MVRRASNTCRAPARRWRSPRARRPATYKVHVPADVDVRAIRAKTGMTQAEFAAAFGFPAGTLRDWEQGRTRPRHGGAILPARHPASPRGRPRGVGGGLMPIRPEHRWLYPIDWPELSRAIRFGRAKGQCEGCGQPHGLEVKHLGDVAACAGTLSPASRDALI